MEKIAPDNTHHKYFFLKAQIPPPIISPSDKQASSNSIFPITEAPSKDVGGAIQAFRVLWKNISDIRPAIINIIPAAFLIISLPFYLILTAETSIGCDIPVTVVF